LPSATSSGAKIHFPPEEDRDEPGYYAFFAFDPTESLRRKDSGR
jgi:hypothetical protein